VKDAILVRGARQNNLKGFDVAIPRRRLTVITGPSGSGKSSLAFDTVYAEGQRRYVESLSAYARQFLERMEKPDVDGVDGVSPAVAIEQKNPTRTSRSTVGTSTEVADYLRLLWARIGRTFCPRCGRELKPDTVQSATDTLLQLEPGTRFVVAFPLKLSAAVTDAMVVENLRAQGFLRVAVDGELKTLEEVESERVKLTLAKAELLIAEQKSEPARVVLNGLLATQPLNGEAVFDLGKTYALDANWPRALLAFEEASNLPDSAYRACLEVATIEVKSQHYTRAVEFLEKAVQIEKSPAVEDFLARVRPLAAKG